MLQSTEKPHVTVPQKALSLFTGQSNASSELKSNENVSEILNLDLGF